MRSIACVMYSSESEIHRRWLVVGSGAIARRHAECIVAQDTAALLSRLSSSGRPPVDGAIDDLMSAVHASWDEALSWKPDLAVVANAATAHADAVTRLVNAGVPVLVEKPLATRADEAAVLAEHVARAGVPVLVGYCLRHHRTVRHVLKTIDSGRLGSVLQCVAHVGQHINDWRRTPAEQSVSLQAEFGGGALLELSHEIDLALKVIGDPTFVASTVSSFGGWPVEAVACLLLNRGNSSASVTLNMLQRPSQRTFTLVGTEGSLFADLIAGTVIQQFGEGRPSRLDLPDQGEMYARQIEHFIHCAEGLALPVACVAEAASVVACIERARADSMQRSM